MKYSLRNFFITFLISLVIFGAAVLLIFGYVQKDINSMIGVGTSEDPITEDTSEEKIKNELSLLLICRDAEGLADTLTIIKIDKAKEDFIFISVPTSMQLELDGEKRTFKSVTSYRDVDYIKNKVTALTGITIDHSIDITSENAAAFIDKLGGITYNVPQDIENDDESKGAVLNIGAGEQTFDGSGAVAMLSYTGYKDGDKTRTGILRDFLETICAKFLTSEHKSEVTPTSLADVYTLISTDYSVNNFITNLDMFFGYTNFKKVSLGYSGSYTNDDGEAVCSPKIADAISDFEDYR